jgi:hypothetical protein
MAAPKFLALRGPLGEPITLTVAGLTATATSINEYVSNNVPGGWAGINRRILAAIGKDPARKPEAIQGRYNEAKAGNWFAKPELGNMGVKDLTKSTPAGLEDLAARVSVGIAGARDKGKKGDWAGESYGYAFEKILLEIQNEIQKRLTAAQAAQAKESGGTTLSPKRDISTAAVGASFPKWAGYAAAAAALYFLGKKARMF